MMMKYAVLFSFLLFMLSSCTRPQVALQDEIEVLEQTLRNDSSPLPDRAKAEELMGLYLKYANDYKDDTLSPAYLLKTGELCVAIGQYDEALKHLAGVMRYKQSVHTAQALFLQGFVCENYLRQMDDARSHYERFVRDYPNHPLAADVKVLIAQLGMSPEDLVRQFEQQQTDSTQLP
jgi:TolA-binding protein